VSFVLVLARLAIASVAKLKVFARFGTKTFDQHIGVYYWLILKFILLTDTLGKKIIVIEMKIVKVIFFSGEKLVLEFIFDLLQI
jgi:hypothetical protein